MQELMLSWSGLVRNGLFCCNPRRVLLGVRQEVPQPHLLASHVRWECLELRSHQTHYHRWKGVYWTYTKYIYILMKYNLSQWNNIGFMKCFCWFCELWGRAGLDCVFQLNPVIRKVCVWSEFVLIPREGRLSWTCNFFIIDQDFNCKKSYVDA